MVGRLRTFGRWSRRHEPCRGYASVEITLLAPALILVMAITVFGWRIYTARSELSAAAQSAARAVSQYPASASDQWVEKIVKSNLANAGLNCVDLDVRFVVDPYRKPGVTRKVTVDVSCTLSFQDLLIPGIPGTKTFTGQAIQPVDRLISHGR